MFKLVIQDDEGKTTVVPLIRDEITIGRKEGNTIRLTERNVSRRHARILRNNGEVQIEDLGSYNGIRVNNARIAERVSLRVSDQVQIGDYKLYLKAEGVEQVDDARTMPIERVEAATDIMPAVTAAGTAPMPIVPAGTPQPPLTRAAVGVADTDPAGRPIASAAQVAALTQPAGYGKLVVISNNFAGREFDLSRPQMIIGRTDENDIVINHRSISRNHAKVTRDPETNRYTISDLQSSNGVRVNSQDYGKVELRRGDTIDLGHVRLRFIEPGEDFIFARDAVITDVPEEGGKRGMLVAVILAVVLLGSVGAFFALRGPSGGDNKGSDITTGGGSSSQLAPPADAVQSAVAVGSERVVEAAPDAVSAAPGNDLLIECQTAQTDRKWMDLLDCSTKLSATDPAAGKKFNAIAHAEQNNEIALGKLQEAVKENNLKAAKRVLDSITPESVFLKQAQEDYNRLERSRQEFFRAKVRAAKSDCKSIDALIKQAQVEGSSVADAIRGARCTDGGNTPPPPQNCASQILDPNNKKCVAQFCETHVSDARCATGGGSGSAAACDADEARKQGTQAYEIGQYQKALQEFETALHCKPGDTQSIRLSFIAACQLASVPKARVFWKKLSEADRNQLITKCVSSGIKREDLDKP